MLAVILNILMRYISSAHMLLVWHRLQFESSGLLVDKAISRVYLMLMLANLVVFIKALLQGYLFSQVIVGILTSATLLAWIYSMFAKTVALSLLEDTPESEYDPNYAMHWWNFYKHPLTAEAMNKLDILTNENCRPG